MAIHFLDSVDRQLSEGVIDPREVVMLPCYSYKGVISVVNGSSSDYPDLLVTRTGTEDQENGGRIVPAKNVTYIFNDVEYVNPKATQF